MARAASEPNAGGGLAAHYAPNTAQISPCATAGASSERSLPRSTPKITPNRNFTTSEDGLKFRCIRSKINACTTIASGSPSRSAALFEGPLRFTPTKEDDGRRYRVTGTASIRSLRRTAMTRQRTSQKLERPQRDLNL